MAENKFEKQRQKDKAKFEKERAQWQKKEAKARSKKKAKFDITRVVFTIIAVVVVAGLVLGAGGAFVLTYGVPARWMPAITVAGTTIRQPEYTVLLQREFWNAQAHAQQMYSLEQQFAAMGLSIGDHFGLDPWATPFGQPVLNPETQVPTLDSQGNPMLNEDGTPMFTTVREPVLDANGNPMYWEDRLIESTNRNFQSQIIMYNEARRLGLTLTDEQVDQIEDRLDDERASAHQRATSLNAWLRIMNLPGYTERVLHRALERAMLVENFQDYQENVLAEGFSEADVRAFVDEDSSRFNFVDVRIQPFVIAEQTPQAAEAARQQASDFLAGVTSEESFIVAAQAILDAEAEDEGAAALDANISTNFLRHRRHHFDQNFSVQRPNQDEPDRLADWLYDTARTNGDTTLFEDETTVHAVMLVHTAYAINAVDFYTLRLPVVPAEVQAPEDDEDWDATAAAVQAHADAVESTLTQADSLLAQFEAAGGSSAAFRNLGQASLLTNALPGSESFTHAESEQWLFEHERQAGDTVILPIVNQQGTIGEVLILFLESVQEDVPNWLVEGRQILTFEAFDNQMESWMEQYPVREHRIGLWFVRIAAEPLMEWHIFVRRHEFDMEQAANADQPMF